MLRKTVEITQQDGGKAKIAIRYKLFGIAIYVRQIEMTELAARFGIIDFL